MRCWLCGGGGLRRPHRFSSIPAPSPRCHAVGRQKVDGGRDCCHQSSDGGKHSPPLAFTHPHIHPGRPGLPAPSLSVCLPPSVRPSFHPCVRPSVPPPLPPVCPSVRLFVCPSVRPSLAPSLAPSLPRSLPPSFPPSLHPSLSLFPIYPSQRGILIACKLVASNFVIRG